MPGMAEPDIAIDIVSATSRMSEVHDASRDSLTRRPRLAIHTLALIGLDALVTATTAVLCFWAFHPISELASSAAIIPTACLTLCVSLCFLERGLYAAPEVASRELAWRKISLAWPQAIAVGTLLTFCLESGLPRTLSGVTETLSGPWLPSLLVSGFVAVVAARAARSRLQPGPAPLNRTVIIGDHDSIDDLMLRIRTGTRRGFDVVGIFEYGEPDEDTVVPLVRRSFLGLPLFTGLTALERMIRSDAVDTVLVALPWSAGDEMREIVRRVSMAPVDVYLYAGTNAFDVPLQRATAAFDLPLVVACTRPIDGRGAIIKRAEDLILAAGLLVAISPVMLTIAAVIKLTSKGPVFFRQRRLGYNNRVIEVLKFRSMYTHLADADAQQQTSRGDKRVTRFGAWLRASSLDELPQLLNVLRGDMSLVGPRPHALATTAGGMALEAAVPVYPSRHRVRPGITGWAQVNGHRGALDSVEKIVHRVNDDLYYIENWSLALDLKILWLTVRLVIADDNAF
jgi:polysaccharide biosynthesis protein PslA